MLVQQNQSHFDNLRKNFTHLYYRGFSIETKNDHIRVKYHFNLSDKYNFYPQLNIPLKSSSSKILNISFLENLSFQIGMIELISYWKAACPQKVVVDAGYLCDFQIEWWKNVYFKGLGEFFYVNGIETNIHEFLNIEINSSKEYEMEEVEVGNRILIPIGGGKDSAVTLELLKKSGFEIIPFILNPRAASLATAITSGFDQKQIFTIFRTLDPKLLELNKKGFLNGHTPFSALLAFISLLAASLSGSRYIALSNESSANEPTIPGTQINHQYSKSIDFENNFRRYANQYLTQNIEYFSFLRPLNELQIGKLFAAIPDQHPHFKSCNVASKTDSWCCKCPKCLFTWIILSPFMEEEKLVKIFGTNLFDDITLLPVLNQLTGQASEKPFECIGTTDETNMALAMTIKKRYNTKLPALLKHYHQSVEAGKQNDPSFEIILKELNRDNFVPIQFMKILKEAIG